MPFSHQDFLNLCYDVSIDSPCVKMKYGAVCVNDAVLGGIVGQGCNGSANPKYLDCGELCGGPGGIRQGVPSGTRLELCHATHAEMRAVISAGHLTRGSRIYIAGYFPDGQKALKDPSLPSENPASGFYCSLCARVMYEAQVKVVISDSVNGPYVQTIDQVWEDSFRLANRTIQEARKV